MALPGSQIYCELVLWDRDPSKFVIAHIKFDGIEIPESPLLVPHAGNGCYKVFHPTVLIPADITYLTIDYEVYNDAGFTELSAKHAAAVSAIEVLDCELDLEIDNAPVIALLKKLMSLMASLFGVTGIISNENQGVEALVDDDKNILADIESDNQLIDASVKENNEFVEGDIVSNQAITAIIQEE